jgi:hypothetical protein
VAIEEVVITDVEVAASICHAKKLPITTTATSAKAYTSVLRESWLNLLYRVFLRVRFRDRII